MMKVASLWKGKDKHGNQMMSGNMEIGSFRVLILKNQQKQGEQPDYHLFVANQDRQRQAETTQASDNGPVSDADVPF